MAVLLKACGHWWLAGFRRLLQITFLLDLTTHCRIPVVLDSIISSAQKYITYSFYKQQFQLRLQLIDRKLFLTETFLLVQYQCFFFASVFSTSLKACYPNQLIKNPQISLNYIIWKLYSFIQILKSFRHLSFLVKCIFNTIQFQYNVYSDCGTRL